MTKKIYFDLRWLNSGGIGRFCSELMKSDKANGFLKIKGTAEDALSIKGMFKFSFLSLNNYVISPGYNGGFFGRKNSIITIHDLMHINFPEYKNLKNSIYYNFFLRNVVRHSPLVFTVSDYTKNEIIKWSQVSGDKVVVLPNATDRKFFNVDVTPFVRNKPYFLYVGNNKKHKNIERLIEAFSLSGISQYCELLLSCSATESLKLISEKFGVSKSVVFLNGVAEKDLPSLYKGALSTILVSLYEGFCIPILESMAVGTPVLTSNVTAMPETSGGAAILVNPYSVNEISEKIKLLYNNKNVRENLTKLGLDRVNNFSWEFTRHTFDLALNSKLVNYESCDCS